MDITDHPHAEMQSEEKLVAEQEETLTVLRNFTKASKHFMTSFNSINVHNRTRKGPTIYLDNYLKNGKRKKITTPGGKYWIVLILDAILTVLKGTVRKFRNGSVRKFDQIKRLKNATSAVISDVDRLKSASEGMMSLRTDHFANSLEFSQKFIEAVSHLQCENDKFSFWDSWEKLEKKLEVSDKKLVQFSEIANHIINQLKEIGHEIGHNLTLPEIIRRAWGKISDESVIGEYQDEVQTNGDELDFDSHAFLEKNGLDEALDKNCLDETLKHRIVNTVRTDKTNFSKIVSALKLKPGALKKYLHRAQNKKRMFKTRGRPSLLDNNEMEALVQQIRGNPHLEDAELQQRIVELVDSSSERYGAEKRTFKQVTVDRYVKKIRTAAEETTAPQVSPGF